jgi:hypothetical protein
VGLRVWNDSVEWMTEPFLIKVKEKKNMIGWGSTGSNINE